MVGDSCASMPVGWHDDDVNRAKFERSPTDVAFHKVPQPKQQRDPHSNRDQVTYILSPVCLSVHGSNSTVPITENTSAVRASNLPDIRGAKRPVRRKTDEGPSMLRTPSSTHRTVLFFTSTASKNQLSSVPMKLMQPFASIRPSLVRRRRSKDFRANKAVRKARWLHGARSYWNPSTATASTR